MNIKLVSILAACVFFTAGCNKSPTPPTANNSDSQPAPAPIQAEPFHGQVYKSLNGRTTLTLVSKDECELSEGGTILLCKYTKPNDTLRVVTTALGTSQVIYFRFTDQGLEDNSGNVLFSPEKYAAAIEQLQRQQREQQREQQEKQRIAQAMTDSKRKTQTISTFSLSRRAIPNTWPSPDKLTVTDVSLILHRTWLPGLAPADSATYITRNLNLTRRFTLPK